MTGDFSHLVPLPLGPIHEKASLKGRTAGARNQGDVCWGKARETYPAATNLGAVDHVSQGGALGICYYYECGWGWVSDRKLEGNWEPEPDGSE